MSKLLVVLIFSFMTVPAAANIKAQQKKHIRSHIGNLELWCGSPSAMEKGQYSFLAAIHNYRSRSGLLTQTATVYEHGHVVMREYVYQTANSKGLSYQDTTDSFSLTFSSKNPQAASIAQFRAVIKDHDGDKMISDGSMSCFKMRRS